LCLVGPIGVSIFPRDGLLHFLGEPLTALLEPWKRVDPPGLGEPPAVAVVDAVLLLLIALEVGSDVLVQEHSDLHLDPPAPGALEVGMLDVAAEQRLLRAHVLDARAAVGVRVEHAPRQLPAPERVEPPRLLWCCRLDDLLQ